MAPEIVLKKTYDYRVDVWSLGILLFELIHKEAPYKGRNLLEIKTSFSQSSLKFSSDVQSEVKDLIEKLLKFNPTERISLGEIFSHPWVLYNLESSGNQNLKASLSVSKNSLNYARAFNSKNSLQASDDDKSPTLKRSEFQNFLLTQKSPQSVNFHERNSRLIYNASICNKIEKPKVLKVETFSVNKKIENPKLIPFYSNENQAECSENIKLPPRNCSEPRVENLLISYNPQKAKELIQQVQSSRSNFNQQPTFLLKKEITATLQPSSFQTNINPIEQSQFSEKTEIKTSQNNSTLEIKRNDKQIEVPLQVYQTLLKTNPNKNVENQDMMLKEEKLNLEENLKMSTHFYYDANHQKQYFNTKNKLLLGTSYLLQKQLESGSKSLSDKSKVSEQFNSSSLSSGNCLGPSKFPSSSSFVLSERTNSFKI